MTSKKKRASPSTRCPVISQLPTVQLDQALNGRRTILREDVFVEYVIRQGLTREQLRLRHDLTVSWHMWNASMAYYKTKYAKEIQQRKHEHYSSALKGNQHGRKLQPAILLPKEKLQTLLERGYGVYEIATMLETSAWFVRESAKHHRLKTNKRLPYKIQDTDLELMRQLEMLVPGITGCAENYYQDPHAFFSNLYLAFTRLNELVWFVKEFKKPHAHYIEKNIIPRDHICWSTNRAELRLSMGLLGKKIAHLRQVAVHRNILVDFLFPGTRLVVEVDGEFHRKDTATRRRDHRREMLLKGQKYQVLHFSDVEVYMQLPQVLRRIQQALSEVSNPLEFAECGTLK